MFGSWISEKYYSELAEQICADFTFQKSLEYQNEKLSQQINSVNSIGLLLRSGDYATNTQTITTQGLFTLNYYHHFFQFVANRMKQPYFFIFSEGRKWVRNNLNIPCQFRYVDCNQGEESYNEKWLMIMYKHDIIDNSSFSLWGAWLNPKQDIIVVATQNWLANQAEVSNQLLQGWVKL